MIKKEETHICRRCGRKLKNPVAKERGMGEVCYKKWMQERGSKKLFSISSLQTSKDSL